MIFGAFYVIIFVKRKEDLLQSLLQQRASVEATHTANINQLQTALQQEIEKRQQVENRYAEMIASIKKDNDEAIAKLANQREKDIKEIMVLYHNDPLAMATAVSTTFNIPIVHFPEVNPRP